MSARELRPVRARAHPARAIRVTAGLAVAGAAVGWTLGSAILGSFFAFGPWATGDSDFLYAITYGGGFGAIVGAIGAPAIGWGLLRHVPLGRVIAETAAGTVLGAAAGAFVDSPVIGGLAGFAAAALRLRFATRVRPSSPAAEGDE